MRKLFLITMTVLACLWSVSAQARTIHGTVVDAANDEPLIGATIMPIGGGTGVAADFDGNFTLTNLPDNVTKATVSYVGYTTKTVELTDNMTVRLDSSSTSLDDVIVVAYGTASKESLTGSVSVVGAKEIEDRPITTVTAALEGNAPGVQVNNTSGTPGSEPDIRIRGFNSINGVNKPLYVVDGVECAGSPQDLNPNDIESMSVLKDAASCALYGAKGANGVILITTKKAKKVGKVDVTLSISQGIYEQGIPLYERLNANEWMQATFDGMVNGLVTSGLERQDAIDLMRETYIGGYTTLNIYGGVDAQGNQIGQANNQLFDENGKFFNGQILPGYQNDRDWWNKLTQTGYRQEYNINGAGATDKFNVFASVGYLKENGFLLFTDFERYTARINVNYEPTSYLRFGINLAGTQQESDQNGTSSSSVDSPYTVLSKAPIYPYYAHNSDGSVVYGEDGQPEWNTAGYLGSSNAPYTYRLDKAKNSATVIDANMYGTAVLPYGFEFTVRGVMHRDKTNYWTYSNNKYGSAMNMGYFNQDWYDIRSYQFFQQLNWAHDYGAHHVDVLVDHENYSYAASKQSGFKRGQVFDDMYAMSNFSELRSLTGVMAKERTESYLGRVRYNYEQKYFGEFSLRRDGSSKFAKDNRWGTFWSVGGSWVISKEKFMEKLPWVNFLKLRASYGTVGNNASADTYAYWPLYDFYMPYGNQYSTLVPSLIPDTDLKWESTNTFDIGIDGTLFNNRLNFSIGYFDKRNADLLFETRLPASNGSIAISGATIGVMKNIGTMSNRGWEISVSGTILETADLLWTASVDATFLRNKLVSLPGGKDIVSGNYIQQEGRSLYQWYMPKYAGVDQLTGDALYEMNPDSHMFATDNGQDIEAFNERIQQAQNAGALRVINGKYYTTNDSFATKEYCGTAIPTVYGSFGTNLSWKGIHFGILFTYSIGGKTYDSNYAGYMALSSSPSAVHKDILKSWTAAPEGMTADSPDRIDPNGIPQINTETYMQNNATSSRWLTSSSYLVLKNLNISYDLPFKWVDALKLQNINIGCSMDNLFTLTARKGLNPQQSWSGSQGLGLNTARVITFSVTARF